MGKIIEIPFSQDLIEFIAGRLFEEGERRDFSSSTIVFTHQRPALYLRRVMAEKLGHPFFPPRVFSMDEFMAFLASGFAPGRTRISSVDSAYLLFQAVKKVPENPWRDKASFSEFLFWGLKLHQVIEELDIELVEDKNLRGLELVEDWGPEVARNAGHLMNHLSQIRRLFHSLLEERNLTTRGKDYARAVKSVEEGNLASLSPVYFAGVFALSRAEKTVIRHFLKEPQGCLVRQNDGTAWTPFLEMDTWTEKEEVGDISPSSPEIFLHNAFNTHSEVVGLKDVLLNKGTDSTRRGDPDCEKTAIVLPEPGPLIPLLSEVMTSLEVDYNITMGYPLSRTPVYVILNLFMNLQESRRDDTCYYVQDYLSLLMHPYIKNTRHTIEPAYMRILIHSLEETLLSQIKTFIELSEVEETSEIFERAARMAEGKVSAQSFKHALAAVHEIFIRKMTGIKTLARLGDFFEETLSFLLQHSPAAHYPFSGEFFRSFFLILEGIKDSLIKDEKFEDPKELFDLFRHLAGEERVSFQGIPLRGLQILGLLETRGLSFDRVLLLDANEGTLPSEESSDSLLPLPVRASLGLPLHYHNEEIYRYHFHHLISSSRQAHIFYRQTEKDFRSRFVERLVWEREKSAGQTGVLEAEPVELNVSLRPSPGFEVSKTPGIIDVLWKMHFSPSVLNAYLLCPVQFYFAYVLGLEERDRLSGELDSAKVGILLHMVLERLYRPWAGKGILKERDYARLEESLPLALEDVFSETFGELRGEPYLLKEMAFEHLRKCLLEEKGRFAGRISIISIEESLSGSLELDDGTTVRLTGRADRIDRCGREYFIVDYKSGRDLSRHSFKAFGEVFHSREEMKGRVKSIQLPFYAFLYQMVRSLSPGEINSRLISLRTAGDEILFKREKVDRKKFLEAFFLPTVKNLIGEILNPEIPFRRDDDERTCRYCSFLTFCRKTS